MLGFRKKSGPTRPFSHATDCKILRADPDVEIPWQEIETGHWEARCVCGVQYHHEAPSDRRVRLDPLDPATFRHAGACDHRDTTDPVILRAILRVTDRENYAWVECSICDCGWQAPYHAFEARTLRTMEEILGERNRRRPNPR